MTDNEKILWDFIKSENLMRKAKSFIHESKVKHIIWKDKSIDVDKHFWLKIGFVDNEPRFEFFCNKEIKFQLMDLKTNELFDVNLGTLKAGFNLAH